jgi:hypothetical protein
VGGRKSGSAEGRWWGGRKKGKIRMKGKEGRKICYKKLY